MTDNPGAGATANSVAVLQGYTQHVVADCMLATLYLLVKPGTDYDTRFTAWDTEEQEFIVVNGWLFEVTEEPL